MAVFQSHPLFIYLTITPRQNKMNGTIPLDYHSGCVSNGALLFVDLVVTYGLVLDVLKLNE